MISAAAIQRIRRDVEKTVVDRSGEPVATLGHEDFEVRVGGERVPVTTFSSEPQPITAVLLLETSIVAGDRFFQMRDAANRFIEALRPGDRVRLGTYGHEIALSPWLTGDTALLKAILEEAGGDLEVKPDADLATTFMRLASELRLPYLLRFAVEARRDHVHRLEVRVRGRSDLTVRAPRGFVTESQ